ARFDHRDSGLSTHRDAPYGFRDMAGDAVAVLDALEWPSAHVVGASLGGMIGQVMAVHHADRVRTLSSLSSAPCVSWRVSRPRVRAVLRIFAMIARTRDPGDRLVRLFRIVGSPLDPRDEERLRRISRTYPPDLAAYRRQSTALRASGDRRAELAGVTAPTLVLHGEDDPLQSLPAARATARAIPNARLVTYPGMGHDLPRRRWPDVIAEIAALADTVEPVRP
ncbi:MAG TPA: alpha/beta hydrolase, partial [Pseudonocardiaceae bacterium]|nr:alpha/beta hydrolase [Pseudonocardiaceae bacterium]